MSLIINNSLRFRRPFIFPAILESARNHNISEGIISMGFIAELSSLVSFNNWIVILDFRHYQCKKAQSIWIWSVSWSLFSSSEATRPLHGLLAFCICSYNTSKCKYGLNWSIFYSIKEFWSIFILHTRLT